MASYFAAALVLAGIVLAAWTLLVEPRCFRVWRIAVPRIARRAGSEVAVLASRVPPLRILHISDVHCRGQEESKLRFLRSVAREPFDLAFLTGDLIEEPAGLGACLKMAELLSPRLGSFAVFGGHDHFYGAPLWHKYLSLRTGTPPPEHMRRPNPVRELKTRLSALGVRVLEDESALVRCWGGRQLAIVGLRDVFMFELDYEAAWRSVPADTATIVLAHSPDVLPEVVRRGADLAFFGHTHGGQVRLPLAGALVTRSQIDRRCARGVFREGATVYTLNNGLGAGRGTGFRLLCRPEVTVAVLPP